MPLVEEGNHAPELPSERRVGNDRRQLLRLRVSRFLNAAVSPQRGDVELQAVSDTGDPIEIVVPVETAMTLLNALNRLSTEDGWFDVV